MFGYTVTYRSSDSDEIQTVVLIAFSFGDVFELANGDGIEILSIVKGDEFKL